MMADLLPISAIVATRNRSDSLRKMLESLTQQCNQPLEMIIVDGSTDVETENLCCNGVSGLQTKIFHCKASEVGAAAQRNQAMNHVSQQTVWLLDDDVLFEKDCLTHLWMALQSDTQIGGVNAMIVNQKYNTPGRISKLLFYLLHGKHETSYAGRCIGPALNLLPEDNPSLPESVLVDWLNTTCTLYRRQALPTPLFPSIFSGYSMLEDVTLSLTVGKHWKLANVRLARIFHDSQPGEHKSDLAVLSKMDLVNRHYVMTEVLQRTRLSDYLKLFLLQIFNVAAVTAQQGWLALPKLIKGKLLGLQEIFSSKMQKFTIWF